MAIIYSDSDVHIQPFEMEAYRFYLEDVFEADMQAQTRCCLERVGPMPKQGVTSMFNFGQNYGFIQGLLTAYSIPYQLILPRTWKGEFGLNSEKANSIVVCKRLFPDVSLRRTDRCRKDSPDFAEALLLAEYCRRKL